MEKPFFSIIVPVYKVLEEYIIMCINSILNQTWNDFELILVDDGSPDNCGEICDTYAKRDTRIKVIHQKNQGVSVARNRGMELACGKWIMFVDADDWIEPYACERIKKNIEQKETDILAFRAFREFNDGKYKLEEHGMEYDKVYFLDDYEDRVLVYRKGMQPKNIARNPISLCTSYYIWDKVYKREVLVENNIRFPVDITNSEDKIFYLECLQKIKTIRYINEILYHYRILPTSATRRYSETIDSNRKKCCLMLKEIAIKMDNQLNMISKKREEHYIETDFKMFTYMISSSILLRKYYHKSYPFKGRKRKEMAVKALNEEPFYSSIYDIKYYELSKKEILRKWLLVNRFYGLFAFICKIKKREV